jgi:hypothetical protein
VSSSTNQHAALFAGASIPPHAIFINYVSIYQKQCP